MGTKARQILADNINTLIDRFAAGGRRSIRAWALSKPAIDPKVVQRALGTHGPTVETIQTLAEKAGLEAWQLLVEGLDPSSPPRIRETLSPMAQDLGRALDAITDDAKRNRAYSLAIQIVELGVMPSANETQAAEDTKQRPSGVPTPSRAKR